MACRREIASAPAIVAANIANSAVSAISAIISVVATRPSFLTEATMAALGRGCLELDQQDPSSKMYLARER